MSTIAKVIRQSDLVVDGYTKVNVTFDAALPAATGNSVAEFSGSFKRDNTAVQPARVHAISGSDVSVTPVLLNSYDEAAPFTITVAGKGNPVVAIENTQGTPITLRGGCWLKVLSGL